MKLRRFFMILSLIIVLVINIMANALPINGLTTGEISDRFPILFVPAGYVFSIWGLIYLALIAFAIYIVTPKGLKNPKIDAIAWWFVAANIFNSAWILLWHYLKFTLTLIPIIGLLISLFVIYLKLRIGKEGRKWWETLLIAAPFSIYIGWATVAVVANVSQVLFNFGYRGAPLTQSVWAVIMLGVATLLGVLMIFLRKEVLYPLVLTWAFIGIWVKQSGDPLVSTVALIGGLLLALLALGRWIIVLFKKS